ncbi:hypothetical protein, variant 1 [Aphanomyces astaci]|uniref:EamA domain-containing protein n=1 Tax=Aphanomyces astaci TaxID=112090 RepID=W4FX90_APHAT|nr:hypothetical protein, variant 1 [Aphanomyces astaci]ETV72125.1 hypothetical protein, variant 1 [Aphanomyces astaci]|eukprot:XP_009838568.1 hypothetical protein, variant 1 [Aphanomyces astaci]
MDLLKSILGFDEWTGKPHALFSLHTLLVLAAVAALMLADVGERFTFKLMVDRMESYRYFLAQITTFLYIPPMFCIVGYKATQTDFIDEEVNEFPKYKFFIMAVLDLCHAMLLFIPGGNTPPALTVIFMQATIPFSMLFGYLFHDYQYSRMQVVGCILMSSGLLLGILPLVLLLASDVFEEAEMGWNSLCFLLAAVPGALSMLYKEQALAPQPMDVYYLNAWVAVYQFIGGLLLAPVIFDIPTLHLDQRISGLECLVNGVSEVRTDKCHVRNSRIYIYLIVYIYIYIYILDMCVAGRSDIDRVFGVQSGFVLRDWVRPQPHECGGALHCVHVGISHRVLCARRLSILWPT